jgi:Mg2+ and Co2+ transporter CorA
VSASVLRLLPAGSCSAGAIWIDAVDPDDDELDTAGEQLALPDAVVQWLRDTNRATRLHELDRTLSFVLPFPDAEATGAANTDSTIIVVMTAHGTLTVHDASLAPTIDAIADRTNDGDDDRSPLAPTVGLIDEAVNRYEAAIDHLTKVQSAHGTDVLQSARGTEAPSDIIADSLELATSVDRVAGRLRRVRQIVVGLRHAVVSVDAPSSLVESLDGNERAVSTLQADLGDLTHRLEIMTDARMSLQSSRQSKINKTIGAWGGIFAVNAVITGWYGMNIRHLPGAGSWVTVAIIMASATAFLAALFRKIDWL